MGNMPDKRSWNSARNSGCHLFDIMKNDNCFEITRLIGAK